MVQTTFEVIKSIADSGEYKRIPVKREILSDVRTPVEVLRALLKVSDHCFLLESVEDTRQWGRYSFLVYDPTMELTASGKELDVRKSDGTTEHVTTDHPGDYVKKIINENKAPVMEDFPPFTGGLVGYFAYDYMQYGEPSLNFKAGNPHDFKDMDLMLFDHLIVYDNLKQKIILIDNVDTADLEGSYRQAVRRIEEMENIVRYVEPAMARSGRLLSEIKPLFDKKSYCEKVEKVKHYIKEGDIFQLVLSNPMEAEFEGSLLNTYRVLRTTNPSPYMFFFSGDMEIAGASPETLVKVNNREICTFPLAGTRPRGATLEEDIALEKELLADEKERAEHNMLVDLGRNDIGKLSDFGTVEVKKYMSIERYSHVMHIGSEVVGHLSDKYEAIDSVDSVLPAGTLSGAPKIRACELIDELENDKRGVYGGAIGYVDFTGNLDTCIAIRFAMKKDGHVIVRSGAGIVADSVPENEYQECINKAKAVVLALKEAEQL